MCVNLSEADLKTEYYSYVTAVAPTRCNALWDVYGKNRGQLKNAV